MISPRDGVAGIEILWEAQQVRWQDERIDGNKGTYLAGEHGKMLGLTKVNLVVMAQGTVPRVVPRDCTGDGIVDGIVCHKIGQDNDSCVVMDGANLEGLRSEILFGDLVLDTLLEEGIIYGTDSRQNETKQERKQNRMKFFHTHPLSNMILFYKITCHEFSISVWILF